jgi:hypothetical protein
MLFGRKKENDSKLNLNVPEFQANEPQKPVMKSPEIPKFPSFEHEFGTIKKEIGRPAPMKQEIKIPERKKEISPVSRISPIGGSKPIFVKIDNYRQGMENIEKIKALCKEADSLLDRIHKIRADEDRELENWHRGLNKIKDKLLEVDNKIFES